MDRETWHAAIHGVAKSWTRLSDLTFFTFFLSMYGCESWTIKKLSAEELMLLNCGVGEDF